MLNFPEMQNPQVPRKRRKVPWIMGLFVLALLVLLIMLQSSNLWRSFSVETASDSLLLYGLSSLNFIAFVIFGFIFLRNVTKLVRERRAFQLGSKIKTRLLLYFAAISLLPIIAMALFSYLFMNRALDRWFAQIPENVTEQARDVQRQAASDQAAKLTETARMLALMVEQGEPTDAQLSAITAAGNLTRIEIIGKNGEVLRSEGKGIDPGQAAELEIVVELARNGRPDEPLLQDGKGFDAAVAPLSGGRKLIVVPDIHTQETVSQKVDNSLNELERLKGQQTTVRQIGLLTLGVLTFLLIFASSWTAFYIARGLTEPIRALAVGADAIAQGDLSHRINVLAEDELAILVDSFNTMSARLEESSAAITEGRRYIETVLQSLPTGIVSFDSDYRVTTINSAAKSILRLDDVVRGELELDTIVGDDNRVAIKRLLSRAVRIGHASEQTVLRRDRSSGQATGEGNIPVALIATALPGGN